MAVTYPTAYVITPTHGLVLPAADAEPLARALRNGNCMFQQWRPPIASAVYTTDPLTARAASYRIPVSVSPDGLTYTARHYVRTGAGAGAVTITIEQQTAGGGWSTIYGPTAHAAGATTVVQIDTSIVPSAGIDELRVTYSRVDPYTPDSVTIFPSGSNAPVVRQASGFWPYDDGLLSATGAPINTELVNRTLRNARAVAGSRAQALLSWVQESDAANTRYDLSAAMQPDDTWITVAHGVASVPYAPQELEVTVSTIASVTGGTTTSRVRVQAGAGWKLLNATNIPNSGTIKCAVSSPGTLQASVTWRVQARRAAGWETNVHAVVGYYTPTMPTALLINTPDTSATTALLSAAVRGVEALALHPWAQPALCYEGNTTNLTTRRWCAIIPPACQRARMALVRSTELVGAIQADSTIIATTTSSVPASAPRLVVTVDTPSLGAEGYYQLGGAKGTPVAVWSSGDYDVLAPGSTVDRLLVLTESLASAIEVVEVAYSTGSALHLVRVRAPADWQDI